MPLASLEVYGRGSLCSCVCYPSSLFSLTWDVPSILCPVVPAPCVLCFFSVTSLPLELQIWNFLPGYNWVSLIFWEHIYKMLIMHTVIFITSLQGEKQHIWLRLKEVKWLVQGHMAKIFRAQRDLLFFTVLNFIDAFENGSGCCYIDYLIWSLLSSETRGKWIL